MSVLVRGYGLDIDSESSIVGYGLMMDDVLPPETEIEALENATIEQLYVIDYSVGRRPMRPADWRHWRRFLAVLRRSRKHAQRKQVQANRLELDFSRGLGVPA